MDAANSILRWPRQARRLTTVYRQPVYQENARLSAIWQISYQLDAVVTGHSPGWRLALCPPYGAATTHRSYAPVAQLDRVLPSEGRGHRFESCRARQT